MTSPLVSRVDRENGHIQTTTTTTGIIVTGRRPGNLVDLDVDVVEPDLVVRTIVSCLAYDHLLWLCTTCCSSSLVRHDRRKEFRGESRRRRRKDVAAAGAADMCSPHSFLSSYVSPVSSYCSFCFSLSLLFFLSSSFVGMLLSSSCSSFCPWCSAAVVMVVVGVGVVGVVVQPEQPGFVAGGTY